MALDCRVLEGASLVAALQDVAALRIAVFRDWPYLYDGDADYEARYLAPYAETAEAVVIGAYHGSRLVGASTAMPLTSHDDDFASAFSSTDIDPNDVYYCAESVLLPDFRGQGAGHRFFDLREESARTFGYGVSAFCAVIRARDHPARPPDYSPLDAFWRGRGYTPKPGVVASFSWKDIGETKETAKQLQFWARPL